jgi:hypothetical protein
MHEKQVDFKKIGPEDVLPALVLLQLIGPRSSGYTEAQKTYS